MTSAGLKNLQKAASNIADTVAGALTFQKSLTDLVRGIRNNRNSESSFISQCIQEIKTELKSDDKKTKTVAVQKLTYLHMRGYDMSWAAFFVIEVIANQKFGAKRVGYLAASQSYSDTTEVIMLITNLIRKDMLGPNQYEAGLAINCLSNICTPDLARDLAPDLVTMLISNRPYIRKKAVLVLYKVFLRFPEALRPSYNRLKDKLEDPDPSVVSAAVNVVCELARKNPQNYISLAPTLFKILTTSVNNWMLIKIIKLFAALTPHEPRLAKKLVEPLTTILNTPAMSLLYEAIQCCITGLYAHENVMKLCLLKLRVFIEHPDQNLKYLGLVAMAGIMQTYPKGVAEHRDLILTCLEDDDTTIRMRALELITGMVNKKNLPIVISKLLEYHTQAEGQYKDDLLEKIIYICSQQNYKFIADFEWYISVLIDLTQTVGSKQGGLVRDQLLDVCVRVEVVRPFAVEQMVKVLRDTTLMSDSAQEGGMCEALIAAAWVVGEYSEQSTDYLNALDALLQPRVATLPANIQTVYLHNVLKVFVRITNDAQRNHAVAILQKALPTFVSSPHLEVQERACFLESMLQLYKRQGVALFPELSSLFEEPLKPVAPIAQSKVPVPEGLDLDAWINEPPKEDGPSPFGPTAEEIAQQQQNQLSFATSFSSQGSGPTTGIFATGSAGYGASSSYGAGSTSMSPISPYTQFGPGTGGGSFQVDAASVERKRMEYMAARAGNPLYLQGGAAASPPPVERLNPADLGLGNQPISVGSTAAPSGRRSALSELMAEREKSKDKKDKKHKKKNQVTVLADADEPDVSLSATPSKSSSSNKDVLDINLTDISPLEQLPTRQHRQVAEVSSPSRTAAAVISSSPASQPASQPAAPIVASASSNKESRHKHKDKSSKHKHKSKSKDKESSPTVRTLYKDSGLVVTYEHAVVDPSKPILSTKFTFKNKGTAPIFGIELNLDDSKSTLQWQRPTPGAQAFNLIVAAGQSATKEISWDVKSCVVPQKIAGTLALVQQREADKAGVSVNSPVDVIVPCSAYLYKASIDQASFIQLLKGPLAQHITTAPLTATIGEVVNTLGTHLGMFVSEQHPNRGSLYCKTILGHDVAVLVKEEGGNESLALAVKASEETLGTSLIREISIICSRR